MIKKKVWHIYRAHESNNCKFDWKLIYSLEAISVFCSNKSYVVLCHFGWIMITYKHDENFSNRLTDIKRQR